MMYAMVYVSQAADVMDRPQLLELLATCRANNADRGITGILLYRDGRFLQLLEGEDLNVRAIYDKIVADARHHDVQPVWVGYAGSRLFTSWSMAFRDLDEHPISDPGFSDLLIPTTDAMALLQEPAEVRRLLHLIAPAA